MGAAKAAAASAADAGVLRTTVVEFLVISGREPPPPNASATTLAHMLRARGRHVSSFVVCSAHALHAQGPPDLGDERLSPHAARARPLPSPATSLPTSLPTGLQLVKAAESSRAQAHKRSRLSSSFESTSRRHETCSTECTVCTVCTVSWQLRPGPSDLS